MKSTSQTVISQPVFDHLNSGDIRYDIALKLINNCNSLENIGADSTRGITILDLILTSRSLNEKEKTALVNATLAHKSFDTNIRSDYNTDFHSITKATIRNLADIAIEILNHSKEEDKKHLYGFMLEQMSLNKIVTTETKEKIGKVIANFIDNNEETLSFLGNSSVDPIDDM